MLIYRATNTVNGKIYIGKTTMSLGVRWKEHLRAVRKGSEYYFHKAIRKYGSDAFQLEVLHTAQTINELNAMETRFILSHQSHISEKGYNLTLGGEGMVPNEEVREKLRQANKGKKPSPQCIAAARVVRLGSKHTEEWKKQASLRHEGNKYRLGHKQTSEWKETARQRMSGNRYAAGYTHTKGWKEAARQRMLGKQYALGKKFPNRQRVVTSATTRAKMSRSHKQRMSTPEGRELARKMAQARWGVR